MVGKGEIEIWYLGLDGILKRFVGKADRVYFIGRPVYGTEVAIMDREGNVIERTGYNSLYISRKHAMAYVDGKTRLLNVVDHGFDGKGSTYGTYVGKAIKRPTNLDGTLDTEAIEWILRYGKAEERIPKGGSIYIPIGMGRLVQLGEKPYGFRTFICYL